jgi:hypothetical protein
MTLGEAIHYEFGFLHYLWVKAMKDLKRQQDMMKDDKNKNSANFADVLDNMGII